MFFPAPTVVNLDPPSLAARIAAIPATPGIYSLVPQSGEAHVRSSANLKRRITRLLGAGPAEAAATASPIVERLRRNLAGIEYWQTGSKLETSLLLYQITRSRFPDDYLRRLRLRLPWFLTVADEKQFPRLALLNRIPRHRALVLGPFASRDLAQRYEEEVEALFQIRRCTDRLHPRPDHPGCIYGEMNQCLRPCQCGVTAQEYASEAARIFDFLATNGRSLLSTLTTARDRASQEMDFEQAAQIHRRIEKVQSAAAARDETVTEVSHFNGVALTRSAVPYRYSLWPLYRGLWQDPVTLDFPAQEPAARSLDSELRGRLTASIETAQTDGSPIEHLALFLRWYGSSWCDGEWFPFRALADLNYRKLVREISVLVKADRIELGSC